MITSHDGFTLRDLWSHNEKHNEANGEDNRDGDDNNHSWNCGAEGETSDVAIQALRRRMARSCLATMFCSLGVPFLNMGDERWRTQRGNNNAYCQDNALSWMDWCDTNESAEMLEFVKRLVRFRRDHPEVRRTSHFTGKINKATGRPDVTWLDAQGEPMTHEAWHNKECCYFAAVLDAPAPLLLLFNASPESIECKLPSGSWRLMFDTASEPPFPVSSPEFSGTVRPEGRSMMCYVQAPA
jgi:glycogen operon protein